MLKSPLTFVLKDLYLTLNMICTFFALQRYHIVLESNMAALIEKKKRKTKKESDKKRIQIVRLKSSMLKMLLAMFKQACHGSIWSGSRIGSLLLT